MRFIALSLSLLAFVAQPALAASSPSLTSLEQQLSSLVANKSADVGVAALDLNTGETVSIKGNTPFPDGEHRQGGDRRALPCAGRQRPPLARRHDQWTARPHADASDAGVQRQSCCRHPVQGRRRPACGPRLAPRQWSQGRSASTARSPDLLQQQARPVGPARFEHADRDGRPAPADLQGRADQAREPQLPARCDVPVRNRQEPDEMAAAVGHAGRAQDGHARRALRTMSGFITLPDGRRVAVAIFTRGGADRPRTIAETARAIYDGFKSVFAWPFGSPAATAQH